MLIKYLKTTLPRIAVLACMMLSLPSKAQQESLRFIENKLTDYRDKTLQEKLFVHTDKKVYIAGEFVWFKMYYVEGYTHQPLHLSRLAYVELLNGNNQAVLQAKVSLKEGEDNGSLYLPLNLPAGAYRLRAYTNWLKNFGPSFYFEKDIILLNPLSDAGEKEKTPVVQSHEIAFFPEGGHLVRDVPSVLAFKANDAYGRGLHFKGWILNERNDTIHSFSPLKFGMGKTRFTPAGGQRYRAIVVFADGSRVEKALPQVQETGYVMQLQAVGSEQLKIEVRTNFSNPVSPLFLIGHTRQVVRIAEQATIRNGSAVFTIDPKRLEPGVTQFTLFDANRQPLAERLYFTRPQTPLKAEVQLNKKEFASREKINLSLQAMDGNGASVPARFSLSVFRADAVQVPDEMNIQNYLLLTSDLMGYVEAPSYYFGGPGEERQGATDNLMLTQGWRRFRWQKVLDEKGAFSPVFPPEVNGPLVTATVQDTRSGKPAPALPVFLSLPGRQYQVYFAHADVEGRLQFELKDYFGQGEMMLKPFSADDSLYRIELQNPFSGEYTPFRPAPLPQPSADLLSDYSIGMQVRQVYAGDSLNRFHLPQRTDTFSFLGKADYTYHLDDYTRFTTMEEVLREYVRPVNVVARRGKPGLVFIDNADRTAYEDNLLVMLDGVPLFHPDRIFSYDPLKVRRLDIFARPYVLRQNYFFSVANFSTYEGRFDGYELDPHLIALDYNGLQMQREFYLPVYETPVQRASRLPDYRNTLYWNPEIKSSGSGVTQLSFYSCDQKGRYLAILQGIDNHGSPMVSEVSFEVK